MENKRKNLRPDGNLTKLGNLIPEIKESLGIENNLKIRALNDLWALVAGFEIAKHSNPAYFDKENNLVINVKSSTLSTELSMQKSTLLAKLKEATSNTDIRFKDIRFANHRGN